ncbi:MAG: TonB-dependent receptor [Myxococcales bacterium]
MNLPRPPRARCLRAGAALILAALLLVPLPALGERMTFLHTPPAKGEAGKNLELVGNIFGANDLARARCRFRQRGGQWKQVDLSNEYGDLYRAVIPGFEVTPPGIEYYCIAFDFFGGQQELFANASSPRRVRVTGEIKPGDDDEPKKADKPPADKPADKGGDKQAKVEKVADKPADKPSDKPADKIADKIADKPGDKVADKPKKDEEPKPALRVKDEELALFGAEDVVSLATKQAQSVSQAPAIASGVPEEQMRSLGLRSLPEVLKLVPGFETSRDVQGFWRVAVRGIRDESALLVLYDGHRLNNAYDSKALLNIPTENVERVEVMRGPGSALFGTGAFLGTVNVVSKRRDTIEAAISGGLQGTVDGHLSAGLKTDSGFQLYGDGSFLRTDGYRREIKSDGATAAMVKAGRPEDEPAGLTNDSNLYANVGAEARYAPAGSAQTKLAVRWMHEERGALVGLFDTLGRDSNLKWDVILADLTEEVPFSSGTFAAHVFFDHQIVDRLFQIAPDGYPLGTLTTPNGLFERTEFTAQTLGLDASVDLSIAQAHKLTLGLSGGWERLPEYRYTLNFEGTSLFSDLRVPTGYVPLQDQEAFNSRLSGGVFLQYVLRPVEWFSLTAGLRVDATQLPQVDADGKFTGGTRIVTSISDKAPWIPFRLGLVFTPMPGWSVKALYGRAFRAPTLQELAEKLPMNDFNQGRFEGNPGLKPAFIDTFELGIEASMAVGENKVRLRGNGFANLYTDPIMAVDNTGNVIPLKNREQGVNVFGAEAELRFEVNSRAYTFLNYSYFRAYDLAAPEGFQYLTDVPQYRVNWAAQIPIGKWVNFAVLAQAGAERRNNGRSKLEVLRHYQIPAYLLFGAQLRTEPIFDHMDVALSASNVTNYDLKDDVARPDAGRMTGLLPREGFNANLTVRARF